MSFLNSLLSKISTLGSFWQEKANHHFVRWNFSFIIIQLVFIVFKFNDLPQQIPLYYSLPWGEVQLASAASIFILPTFCIVILLFNNLVATGFLKTIPLFSRLLTIFSLVFSFFALISIVNIITTIS